MRCGGWDLDIQERSLVMKKLTTREFNNSLCPEARTRLVDFKTFKERCRKADYGIDRFFANVKRVRQFKDCIAAEFENGAVIRGYFSGYYEKFSPNGKLLVRGDEVSGKCLDDCHIRIMAKGGSITLEMFIAVCADIAGNEMPVSYRGWAAAVLDGSGVVCSENLGKINRNYHPDNIEWCLYSDGIVHDKIALLLAKVPDKRYRFSGNNKRLLEVFQTKNPRVFKEYCDKNLRD